MTISAKATTPEEHLDYLVESVRLMLWFARNWARAHPEESIEYILQKRVDIYRRTGFNSDFLDGSSDSAASSGWAKALRSVAEIYAETQEDSDSELFERKSVEIFLPGMRGRIERDLADIENRRDLSNYQCGSLRFDSTPNRDNPRQIGFHIANACYPGSLFDDPLYLPGCLLTLMGQCEARFGVEEVGTGTWLNSHPKWLTLFPPAWTARLEPTITDIKGHYGFWGQFLTARKTFNHKLARKFRETGVLPYGNRKSWCRIDELRPHLLALIASRG